MIHWPNLCVGCGERDTSQLKAIIYKWQRNLSPNYNANYANYYYFDVHAAVCHTCYNKARNRFIFSLLIALAGLFIGFPLVFGALGEIFLPGLLLLCPAVAYFVYLLVFKRHFPNYYMKFKIRGRYLVPKFKSKEYQEEFQLMNPSEILIG